MTFGHAAGSVITAAAVGVADGATGGLSGPIVVGAFGLAGIILGPIVADRLRRRRPVDHKAETRDEQTALNDWLRGQLDHKDTVIETKDAEIRTLRIANDRLRREKR